MIRLAWRLTLLSFVLVLFASCAPKYKGDLFLYPGKAATEGYSTSNYDMVFENKDVKFTVGQITTSEESASFLVDDFLLMNYVLLRIRIENKTRYKIIFNPALVSLKDNKMGYEKPLDYTDFYQLSRDDNRFSRDISGLAKVFYDRTEIIKGGITRTKILVFPPFEKGVKKANLIIQGLYIGRENLDLTFPFVLKTEEPVKKVFESLDKGKGYNIHRMFP
ncbi:MAG: hypothetical protein BMS9Abin23_0152 [Thermodesulfobacteriota bacterium]|nr:MAG: hypothetical protein BMS9Abin23_0152 [Thermodesulfobacteriota bacterium]